MFVNSYLGIQKWQFALILTALVLTIWKKQPIFLLITLLAYQTDIDNKTILDKNIKILTTYTDANDKWNKRLHKRQFDKIFKSIDSAIENKKTLIVLPESIFPVFLSRDRELMDKLKKRAEKISIVTGALYWNGETPHNSSYIFTNNKVTIANKVVLVPFGESNPLPDFLSNWVNKVFYDSAVDYKADTEVTDYIIDGVTYRNAICFEATSEKLYVGEPKQMIVLSNNAWFVPSTEPTLQKLLLQYYSKKYRTTIYHSTNMSESYIVREGKVF
jgi:apolipoprotein N-acyltransferase